MEDVKSGGVPRLGAAVPRWYGETIGFWDKDTLITWTSNIQGWKSHSEFEFSSKMQSVEMYTPIRENGLFLGLTAEDAPEARRKVALRAVVVTFFINLGADVLVRRTRRA